MSNPDNYTVGWICAIQTEYVAAQSFLDEEHERPEFMSTNDNNDYTLGKVGKHNVVIAVLPEGEYGISSAAAVARDMLHSFTNVRMGLMVGIGGGAPGQKHDIRLGDIVVSAPRDGKGGVFQYDFGKTIQDQSFRSTGFLNQPPALLRAAVNGLKAQYERKGHRLEEAINSVLEDNRRMRQKYKRPDRSSDRLYHPGVIHPPGDKAGCASVCGDDPSRLILRLERTEDDDNPAVYYGLIASANQLMKDATVRDRLTAEKDVLCFEMEAAGLMNHFPCLVIRGICDYSDSHKNKEWQGYAAMAAAAYAKDLLYRIAPNIVEAERKITEVLSSVKRDVNEMSAKVQDASNAVKHLGFEQRQEKIDRWLLPPDPSTNYNKALEQRYEGSGHWFLASSAFTEWKTRRSSFLWLHGIPGCGKTILSSAIIKNLNSVLSSQPLLYFYFGFADIGKQTLESMIRSLISQLYYKHIETSQQLDTLFSSCEDGLRQLTCRLLCEAFLHIIEQVEEVWLVLDALDECRTRKGLSTEGLLSWIREVRNSEQRNVHLLVTSRPEQDIESKIMEFAHTDDVVPIQSNLITNDIRTYVRARVREDNGLKRWRSQPEVQNEIKTRLMEKVDGMFRWAACQLDALENCLEYRTLQNALASLPKTLDETYARILRGIPEEYKQNATRILQFLTYSERPLRIEEAVDAIVVDAKADQHFNPKYRMPNPYEISCYCSSLVVIVSANDKPVELQLAHFSVKEYLTSNRLDKDIAQSFQATVAKASIAIVCLAYLLHLDLALLIVEIQEGFPLAQYCAKYWITYAAVAESKDETLQGFIREFFCYHINSYRNCYSLYRPDYPGFFGPDFGEGPASALYYASFGGLVNAVEYLLSRGANVHAQGGRYSTALHAASHRGHDKIVELLLSKGADVHAQCGLYGTALQAASLGGHDKTVELLLSKGADVRARDGIYGTALHAASLGDHDKIVELLLSKGADVHAQDGYYGTALHAASLGGHDKIVELLLSKGADVHAQGGHYGTALQAASFGGHDKTVELLLSKGADVRAQGGYYCTAFQAASWEGHGKIVELLLSKGADVHAQGGHCGTALQAASQEGHDKIVELLLSKGADVHAQGGDYGTALHAAWLEGHDKVVELLLSKGADVHGNYGTALQAASRRGYDKIVELLLSEDAEVYAQDRIYSTAP